ncbi:MAG: alpha-L-fucosidase [Spirochaetales bacterium]|nr:alpha-L-fucosidase [Spirochaetales bacterium]
MTNRIEVPEGPFAPTWDSLAETYRVPAWYKNGKFGIFIHWGAYTVPAFGSEWYPRNMYLEGSREYVHHIKTYGKHKDFGYKDFIPQFKAERFDADEWADIFKNAGARFVVPVAEHHDGFAMYDCSFSDWCAAKMGPKRDVIGELAKAVRQQWMVFGLSSHRAEHWWFMDGGMQFESDVRDGKYAGLYGPAQPKDTQPNEEYLDDWLSRTCELVDKYQPQIVWFDWWIEQPTFVTYLKRFAAYYYNRAAEWDRGAAINFKYGAFPHTAGVYDIERGQLDDINPLFWQTDTSVGKNSWSHVSDLAYKTSTSIIGDLVDIVSKNGALLLNIGPKSDGSIPQGDQKILKDIGRWLVINGNAIYDSRPWKAYGEGPTSVQKGAFTDTKRTPFTSQDIRFTARGDVLYAIMLAWPEKGEVIIQSLGSNLRLYTDEIGSVELLGSKEPLKWSRTGRGLRVTLPAEKPCEHAYVVRIEKKIP